MKNFSKEEERRLILAVTKKRLKIWGARILGALIGLIIILGLGTIRYILRETKIDKFGERVWYICMLGTGAVLWFVLFFIIGIAIVYLISKEKERIDEDIQEEKSKIIKEQSNKETEKSEE